MDARQKLEQFLNERRTFMAPDRSMRVWSDEDDPVQKEKRAKVDRCTKALLEYTGEMHKSWFWVGENSLYLYVSHDAGYLAELTPELKAKFDALPE